MEKKKLCGLCVLGGFVRTLPGDSIIEDSRKISHKGHKAHRIFIGDVPESM
jgi:hypothetical protein